MRSRAAHLPVAPRARSLPRRPRVGLIPRGKPPEPRDGLVIRARVLDAAEHVFADRGYVAATTREIAAAAGIPKRMLFYYFPTKDAVYRAVLARVAEAVAAIHRHFQNEPGPVGLGDAIVALTHFTAANLPAFKVLLREIVDGGPHLTAVAEQYLRPLFAAAAAEVTQNQRQGVFRTVDPMHMLMNVGGLTLWYFLNVPLLRLIWDRDPLAPDVVAERSEVVREFLLNGLATTVARGAVGP